MERTCTLLLVFMKIERVPIVESNISISEKIAFSSQKLYLEEVSIKFHCYFLDPL